MDLPPAASDRIAAFVDPGTFSPVSDEETPFHTIPRDAAAQAGDGVTAGFAAVDGRPVAVYAHDPRVFGGSVGLGEARRICTLLDGAAAKGCPVVGFIHSAGARIQQGVDSLAGYAEIFRRNVRMSGEVPQISVVLGPCAGGAVYSPALTDFIVLLKGQGEMFITGPDVIRRSTGERTDRAALGGSEVHLAKSGVGHFGADTFADSCALVRRLLAYLPSNRRDAPPAGRAEDDPGRLVPSLDEWSRGDRRRAFEVGAMVEAIMDRGSFLEVQKDFARNIVVGFARLGGIPVGAVANNSAHLAGALDIPASEKAARFVRFCNEFGLPVVTFVDVPGYWPGVAQEHAGIIRHGAKLLFAYAEATVPRLSVVLHKAYGGAYDVMSSKHLGADYNAAWPTAELAVMGPQGAVEIIHRDEIASAADPERVRAEKIEAYVKEFVNPRLALGRGYLDETIQPAETRRRLCAKLKELWSGRAARPPTRGNIPL